LTLKMKTQYQVKSWDLLMGTIQNFRNTCDVIISKYFQIFQNLADVTLPKYYQIFQMAQILMEIENRETGGVSLGKFLNLEFPEFPE